MMNKNIKHKKVDSVIIQSKSPNIFSIPRPFEDDYERNDAWYKKMQRLEVEILKLKQNFNKLSVRQNIRKQETNEIIMTAKKLVDKFLIYKTKS
jgi:hypothetical protein